MITLKLFMSIFSYIQLRLLTSILRLDIIGFIKKSHLQTMNERLDEDNTHGITTKKALYH